MPHVILDIFLLGIRVEMVQRRVWHARAAGAHEWRQIVEARVVLRINLEQKISTRHASITGEVRTGGGERTISVISLAQRGHSRPWPPSRYHSLLQLWQ